MLGLYFSGTGNTKHCVETLAKGLDENSIILPIEDDMVDDIIHEHEFIVFGFPVQYSNMPYFVSEFIKRNRRRWAAKRILIVCTQALFSGDGAGVAQRLFKRYGGIVVGGLHLKMPSSIGDKKTLQKDNEENRNLIIKADWKISKAIQNIKNGKYPKDGLKFHDMLLGFFIQRLWFGRKTRSYSNKLSINENVCSGCGACERICPLHNVRIKNGKAYSLNRCTMCYRCISYCPSKAITLLGSEVIVQKRFDQY